MIAILMSTYNGEKYLREQIESFFSQTFKDWKLFIRDDGSKDNTQSIISEFARKYPEQIFLIDSAPADKGVGESFMHLLRVVDAEYYMFSDQDDVWMPQKIEHTFNKLMALEKQHGNGIPIGVFTDLCVTDEKLNVLMPSLWRGDNRNPELIRDFYIQWTNRHCIYGCTLMLNRAVKSVVFPYHQALGLIHDVWIEYILIHEGVYDYIDEPTIFYRQHGDNAIGANFGHSNKSETEKIIKNPLKLIPLLRKDYLRARMMPFHVSYLKILYYRIKQSLKAIF